MLLLIVEVLLAILIFHFLKCGTCFLSMINKGARLCFKTYYQGRREGGAEEAVCPRASGSSGTHERISKFLFIASSDVLMEPPNRTLSAPSCPFDQRHKRPHFAPGSRKPLGCPTYHNINSHYLSTVCCRNKWTSRLKISV